MERQKIKNRDLGAFPKKESEVSEVLSIADYRKRWAVIVGVNDYFSEPSLSDLNNAANDACLIHLILSQEFGFNSILLCKPQYPQQLLFDEIFSYYEKSAYWNDSSGIGSRKEIINSIFEVAQKSNNEDIFVFFYSGHASNKDNGFIVPYGARLSKFSSILMYEELFGAMDALPCKHKLCFFDCCYAGMTTRNIQEIESQVKILESKKKDSCPIHLDNKSCIIAATDSFNETPDAFTTNTGVISKNSPFTHALAKTLHEVEKGKQILPAEIYSSIYHDVTNCSSLMKSKIQSPPRYFEKGEGFILLSRPGIHINIPNRIDVTTQSTETYILKSMGGTSPYKYTIDNTVPDGIFLYDSNITINIDIKCEIILTIRSTDINGLSSTRDILIVVNQEKITPPEILTTQIPPCIVGEEYSYKIQTEGGKLPIEWSVSNLPQGLNMNQKGEIKGIILKNNNDKVSQFINITIYDSKKQEAHRKLRIVIVDLDIYCEIPAGKFLSGFHKNTMRNNELNRLKINNNINDIIKNFYPKGNSFLPRYFIKRFPVTNKEWKQFMDNHPDSTLSPPKDSIDNQSEDDLPVTNILYDDIIDYCRIKGTRLPTGREWEKAARGTDGRLFPWGDVFNIDYCNCSQLGFGLPTHVNQFPHAKSPYGVCDMLGNVFELVSHYIQENKSWYQTLRGGCYESSQYELNCFIGSHPVNSIEMKLNVENGKLLPKRKISSPMVGFRDVIEVEESPAYPQGFIKHEKSRFRSPYTQKPITNQRIFIARYAVSNEEYLEFIKTCQYAHPSHWRKHNDSFFPFEERYYPVVNVSYDDAIRFCKWKSQKLGVECKIVPINLYLSVVHGPGDIKKIADFTPSFFPWGNHFDPMCCNSSTSGWGGLARVFDMPDGQSRSGAYNIIGNIAEWSGPSKVFGGSWLDPCEDYHSWVQKCEGPRFDVGFRYYTISNPLF